MSLIAGESFFEKDAVRAALRSAFRARAHVLIGVQST